MVIWLVRGNPNQPLPLRSLDASITPGKKSWKSGVGYKDSWKRRGKPRSPWTHAVAVQDEHSALNDSEDYALGNVRCGAG